MKKMLNTLYVTSDDVFLSLKNDNVLAMREDEQVGMFPLIGLESIVSFSYKGASTALLGACHDHGISVCFMTPNGRFLTQAAGRSSGNVLLRREQYRIADDEVRSCAIARNMILGKVFNSRWVIERSLRDHALRVDTEKLKATSVTLAEIQKKILESTTTDVLRGLEGEAAVAYYSVWNELILNQKETFLFQGRNRRPPLDPVNAMLSFGYTLLAHDCASALEGVGLDSYVGFMHTDRPGRISLALDLEEQFRAAIVDRLVLSLINLKSIQAKHFEVHQDGSVYLNTDGRKIMLKAWQEKKKETLTHPFLHEKMEFGLVAHIQSLLLARTIRGDLDAYPPFLWK